MYYQYLHLIKELEFYRGEIYDFDFQYQQPRNLLALFYM